MDSIKEQPTELEEFDSFDSFESLETTIQTLKTTSNLLLHRLDSVQTALKHETFELDTRTVQLKETANLPQVKQLLEVLNLHQVSFPIGTFIRALNTYILQEQLVDLNTLHIHLTPLLASVFQAHSTLQTVPYGFFLKNLPLLFV